MLKPGGFVEPYRHIENPDPKRRLLKLVQASGLLGEMTAIASLDAFHPELIIGPCGYGAGRFDPLGRMLLDDVSFRWMTRAVADMAQRHAGGRLLLTHEGGYCPASVPFFGMAVLEELSGLATDVQSPYTAQHGKVPGNALADHQREHIAQLARYFQDVRQRHWR